MNIETSLEEILNMIEKMVAQIELQNKLIAAQGKVLEALVLVIK